MGGDTTKKSILFVCVSLLLFALEGGTPAFSSGAKGGRVKSLTNSKAKPIRRSRRKSSSRRAARKKMKAISKLRDIELLEKIEKLKESVFDLKARLFLIREATVRDRIILSGLTIIQENDLSDMFRGEAAGYLLDNKEIFTDVFVNREMPSDLTVHKSIVSPGIHEIKLQVSFSGKGKGVYSYLNDYVFVLKSRKRVNVREGKRTVVYVTLVDEDGIVKSMKNRPRIVYEIKYRDIDSSFLAREPEKK